MNRVSAIERVISMGVASLFAEKAKENNSLKLFGLWKYFLPLPLQIKKKTKMAKHLRIIALCGILGLFFASCSHPSVVGTWVEPANEDGITSEIGFTLLENGEVIPINMGYVEFKNWEKSGDMLYMKGTYTGTNPHDFVDTMKIVKVDDQQLVLEQGGYQVMYQKK